jgi:hypothetical protein
VRAELADVRHRGEHGVVVGVLGQDEHVGRDPDALLLVTVKLRGPRSSMVLMTRP